METIWMRQLLPTKAHQPNAPVNTVLCTKQTASVKTYRGVINWEGVHKDIPISQELAQEILEDALGLYPEAVAISIVGTYSRATETPSHKPHDVDFLIRFPEMGPNEYGIRMRDDFKLWHKWREKIPVTIDFLMRFGEIEPNYGHHQERLKAGLPTPEVPIWKSCDHIQVQ